MKSKNLVLGVIVSMVLILAMALALVPTVTESAQAAGTGTSADPYQIGTKAELIAFRDTVNGGERTACAVLTADIDLENEAWTPIGTSSNKYDGTFDGKGYTIRGLYINSDSDDRIGFISYTGPEAKIKNLTLEGSITATSYFSTPGAFVGSMDGGLITNCTNKATVTGALYAGGIVGRLYYDSSYNRAKVEKSSNQGAVTCTVSGAGGIAANNYGTIENCYNTGAITGVNQVGGIAGLASDGSTTSRNFNYGTISGTGSKVGNIAGERYNMSGDPVMENNYYLSATPNKGIGNEEEAAAKTKVLTADEFKVQSGFTGWDFDTVWLMGKKYPLLRDNIDEDQVIVEMVGRGFTSNPYQISTAAQLKRYRDIVNGINDEQMNNTAYAILMNDIDLDGSESNQWVPFADFNGTFDGNGHTISGIYINTSATHLGFFTNNKISSTIRNLTLQGTITNTCTEYEQYTGAFSSYNQGNIYDCRNEVTVTAPQTVGGIAGMNENKIERCVNAADLTVTRYEVAGIAAVTGSNSGYSISSVVKNCYNLGTITGGNIDVGGIVGYASGQVENCFNLGTVSDSGDGGAIVGENFGTLTNNYYLTGSSDKGVGDMVSDLQGMVEALNSAAFKDQTNFSGWDFENVWKMGENYPEHVIGYNIWIGNDLVSDAKTSGTGWSYDRTTNTLTLHDYVFEADGREVPDEWNLNAALMYTGADPLTIILEGDNSIINTATNRNVSALYCKSPLTIEGTGSLYLTTTGDTTDTTALTARDSLTINGGTLVVKGGDALIEDGTASSYGIYVHDNGLVINGGSVTVIGGKAFNYSYAISAWAFQQPSITISGNIGSLVVIAGEAVGNNEYQHQARGISASPILLEASGTGWTDAAGTEGEAAIEAGEYNSNPFSTFMKVQLIGGTMITIEIADKETSYNEDAPAYTYVAEIDDVEVTDADLLAAIATKITLGSTYTKGSDAGNYDIVNTNAAYNEKFTIGTENYIISSIVTGTLTVNKINAVVTAPTAKTGLHYTGVAQELVNAGSTTGGTIEYKLNDGEWSTAIPTAINVDDDYIVSYRVVGGTNYNDIAGVAMSEAIEIEENDKTLLTFVIGLSEAYYDTIETEYPTVAAVLFDAIDEANAVLNDANKTKEEISNAVETLTGAVLNAQVGVVEEKIDAIPSPVTLDSEDEIIAAREAYDNLSDDQQTQVINRDALFAAEIDLAEALIADIGEVVYTTGCKDKIDKARDYFDGLDEDEQALIGEDVAQALEDAEEAYDKLAADNAAADAVDALIAQIDDPVVYPTSGAGIQAARTAYNVLTEDQKALVDDYSDLTTAENEYNAQKNAGIENAEDLIDAIGAVTYPGSKDAVKAAKDAFDALTDEQKALVDDEHKDALADAEAAYKALEDAAKAGAAKALIEAIGEVEDTQSSKDKIDAAREAYDALTEDQKALITEDAPTIVTAEATYTILHTNNLAAAEVIALIEAIGTVEYTETSKNKIDTAKEAYADLTDAQKAIVDNYLSENEVDTIVVSETIYIGLGDQQKAQIVITKISAIGEVKYPESKDLIQEARTAYDELTVPQKELVENYEVLEAAEATYAELEAEANKGLSGGAIAGIVIGCVAFVAIVCFLLWFFLFKKKKEDKDEPKVAVPETNDEPKNDQTDEPKE